MTKHGKRKDVNYQWARKGIYEKDIALDNFIDNMLVKCRQMFVWENLPSTIPQRNLENYLTENGSCIFAQHEGSFYVFVGGAGGEPNVYYEPTIYTVANPALKLSKMYEIDKDCVFMWNDSKRRGLLPILSKYAVLVNDCEISLNMIANVLRAQYIITASDNRTLESANIFIKKLTDGDFSAIGNNAFLDSIKISDVGGTKSVIHDMIELTQYLKASAYNEIGLDANYNMKRERLTANEVDLNQSILVPLAQDMLAQRQIACEKINKMYGLNVSVNLASVWKMQTELMEQAIEMAEQSRTNDIGGIDNGGNGATANDSGIITAGDDGDNGKNASAVETDNGATDNGATDSGANGGNADIGGKEDDGNNATIDGKLESADDTSGNAKGDDKDNADNADSGNDDGNNGGNDDGNGKSGADDTSGNGGGSGDERDTNGSKRAGSADIGNDGDNGGSGAVGGNGGGNGSVTVTVTVPNVSETDVTVDEGKDDDGNSTA